MWTLLRRFLQHVGSHPCVYSRWQRQHCQEDTRLPLSAQVYSQGMHCISASLHYARPIGVASSSVNLHVIVSSVA